jgi:hypothetical protein
MAALVLSLVALLGAAAPDAPRVPVQVFEMAQ